MGTALGREKLASFGLVARDRNGEVMAATSFFPTVALTTTIAEALCLRWAMVLASQLGFRNVQFETDSLQLFQAWRKREGSSYLFFIIQDCFRPFNLFDHVDLVLSVERATLVRILWLRMPPHSLILFGLRKDPSGLLSFLQADILASMPPF